MKRLLLLLVIGCAVAGGAAERVLDNSGNYMPLLDMPKEKLGTGLQDVISEIKASKISTPDAAITAVLKSADDKPHYMRDSRMGLRVKSLRRIGRDVTKFAKCSDFVWVVDAEMFGSELVQIFCVNARNGKVIRLFQEDTTPNHGLESTGAPPAAQAPETHP